VRVDDAYTNAADAATRGDPGYRRGNGRAFCRRAGGSRIGNRSLGQV